MSARNWWSFPSKLLISTQYKKTVERTNLPRTDNVERKANLLVIDQGGGELPTLRLLVVCLAVFEDIPYPADNIHELLWERVIHLPPQAATRDIYDVSVTGEVHVPDLLCDQSPGQHLAHSACQEGQESEFLGGETEMFPATPCGMSQKVNLQVRDADDFRLPGLAATKHGTYPSKQL